MSKQMGDANFYHAQAWWEYMNERATERDGLEGFVGPQRVYEGSVVEAFEESLGKSKRGVYQIVTRALVDMGSVHKLISGAQGGPSIWVLLKEPDIDTFRSLVLTDRLQKSEKRAKMDDRLNKLEADQRRIWEALADHEERLTQPKGEH